MGYCMTQRDSSFVIIKDNQQAALKAVQSLAGGETISDSYGPHYSWVDKDFAQNKDLRSIMDAWRWTVRFNDEGDVVRIDFDGEKLGDDIVLFKALAPFVKKDSFIEMDGEDGCLWRWVFDGTTCKETSPTVTWE